MSDETTDDDPRWTLQELLSLRAPPEVAKLQDVARISKEWAASYAAWHRDLMQSVAAATLSRREQLLERISRMKEDEVIAILTSETPEPIFEDESGRRHNARPLYEAFKKIHLAGCAIHDATNTYLDVLAEAIDSMLGDNTADTADEAPRALQQLAEILAFTLVPFACEVDRLRKGTALVIESLGQPHPGNEDAEQDIGDHVVMMAHAGHPDGAIARVLGTAFPEWASSARARVRAETGTGSAPQLEGRRVHELLTERVRKMRSERGVPAGRAVRQGRVDPLEPLRKFLKKEPEAGE